MDSLTKVGFYFFITNYVKHPIPRLHTHEAVLPKASSDSSVSQVQARAQLHETGPRHRAHPRHLLALLPTSPALYPPPQGGGVPHQYGGAIKPIKVRLPSYIAPHAKLYCFPCEAILVRLPSNIGAHTAPISRTSAPTQDVLHHPACLPSPPIACRVPAQHARATTIREEGFTSRARTIIYKEERSDHPHSEGIRPPQRIALTLSTQPRKVRKSVVIPTKKE